MYSMYLAQSSRTRRKFHDVMHFNDHMCWYGSIDLWDTEILQWLQILTPGCRSGRPVFHLSSSIFLNSMFQCFTFHLSKFNVSIFHLHSAIRLFQRTGRLGHASPSCMHESVIPLGHKQHSTQTLKYVDKNFPPAHPLGYMQLHGLTLRRLRLEHAGLVPCVGR